MTHRRDRRQRQRQRHTYTYTYTHKHKHTCTHAEHTNTHRVRRHVSTHQRATCTRTRTHPTRAHPRPTMRTPSAHNAHTHPRPTIRIRTRRPQCAHDNARHARARTHTHAHTHGTQSHTQTPHTHTHDLILPGARQLRARNAELAAKSEPLLPKLVVGQGSSGTRPPHHSSRTRPCGCRCSRARPCCGGGSRARRRCAHGCTNCGMLRRQTRITACGGGGPCRLLELRLELFHLVAATVGNGRQPNPGGRTPCQ